MTAHGGPPADGFRRERRAFESRGGAAPRRALGALLLLSAAFPAFGDEPPKAAPDAVKTQSPEEFAVELRAIEQADATTVQRIARRLTLAAARLIHREGRILDVRPADRDGRTTVCIDVRGLHDAEETVRLVPEDCAVAAVLDWNRGDGVAWIERPRVGPDGEIEFEPVVATLADVRRVPDPDAAPGGGDSDAPLAAPFATWFRRLVEPCRAGDWRRAWLVWEMGEFAARTWVLPAHVTSTEPGAVVVAFDDPVPEWPDWGKEAVRCGIGRQSQPGRVTRRIVIAPAKPAETPTAGDAVEIALDVVGFPTLEKLAEAGGVFTVEAALRRPEPATPPAAVPVPKTIERPTGKPAEYARWIEKFATAAHAGDVAAAAALWADAAGRSWIFPAVVKGAAAGRFEGRFCRDAFFKGTTRYRDSDPARPSSWTRTVERPAGLWGFDPKKNHEFVVTDPELVPLLHVNSFVDVVIDLDPDGAAQAMAGPFPATLTIWRLTGTAARTPPGPR